MTVGLDAQLARHLPFIFAPVPASIEKPRVTTWKTEHTDGQACLAKLAVLGTFNGDEDLRLLLVLFKIAQDATANEDGSVTFSFQETARLAHRGWRGRHGRNKDAPSTVDDLARGFLRLRGILFMPSRVYTDDEGHRIEISEPITFLDKLRLGRRSTVDPATGEDHANALVSLFRFNEYSRRELASRPLKPLIFDTAMALPRSHPYALRAYLTFDRNLAPKNATHYEWTATALLAELKITLTDQTPSARRRFLDGLVKHLDGKPISRGTLHLHRKPTNDRSDWKLILTRTAARPRTKQLDLYRTAPPRAEDPEAAVEKLHRQLHPEHAAGCPRCAERLAARTALRNVIANLGSRGVAPTSSPAVTPDPTPLPITEPPTSATVPELVPDPGSGITGTDMFRAVAPAAPDQSHPAPPAGARREGSASHSEPDT